MEEPGDPSDRIRGQRVSIREVEAVFLAWIGHLLGSGANSVGKLYEFLSLGQRDVAIRFAMQFDQRRQTLDSRDHRVRHSAVEHGQCRDAIILGCCPGSDKAAKPSKPMRPELSGRAKTAVTADDTRFVQPSNRCVS